MPTTSEVSTRLSADNSQYRSVMNQSADVADKAGKSIMKKLDIRAGMMAVAAAVGFNLQNIAEGLARMIIGFSSATEQALDELVISTGKAADAQERLLEKTRARIKGERDEQRKAEDQTEDVLQNAMRREEERLRKVASDRKKLADEAATDDDVVWYKQQARIEAEKKLQLDKIEEVKAAELAASEEAARVEEARIAEKFKSMIDQWKNFTGIITSSGRGDKELTDRELQRKIANIQNDIFQRQVASPGQPDFFLEPQKNNLRQTVAEMDLRNTTRRNASAFGEDRAFAMSGLTEQRFREILQGIDTTSTGKLASAIDKLNQRLDQPLKTIDMTPVNPFTP
jgi:hypothetical protein